MPVIINEFEIVPGPAPKAEDAPAPSPSPPRPLIPEDIERIEERHRLRCERLWAD
jgi:hypothetical protein